MTTNNHLDEAARQLREELAARREAEAELEALRSSAARVPDLVLGDVEGLSLLSTSMSTVAERLEGRIDTVAANGVCWGSCSALVVAVSHFLELDTDLEVVGSGRNASLTKGEVDALWSWVCTAADSLASHVPSLVAHNPPDSVRE
jgi:hypothetical protein